jgi:hypothetical protein
MALFFVKWLLLPLAAAYIHTTQPECQPTYTLSLGLSPFYVAGIGLFMLAGGIVHADNVWQKYYSIG